MNHTNLDNQAAVFWVILIVISAYFGYVVGKNDKDDHLSKQQQIQQLEQKKDNQETQSH